MRAPSLYIKDTPLISTRRGRGVFFADKSVLIATENCKYEQKQTEFRISVGDTPLPYLWLYVIQLKGDTLEYDIK